MIMSKYLILVTMTISKVTNKVVLIFRTCRENLEVCVLLVSEHDLYYKDKKQDCCPCGSEMQLYKVICRLAFTMYTNQLENLIVQALMVLFIFMFLATTYCRPCTCIFKLVF